MPEYKTFPTKNLITIDGKNFQFPMSGEKILLKVRPPIAKKVSTD